MLRLQRPCYAGAARRPSRSPELLSDRYGFGLRMGRWRCTEAPKAGRRELCDLLNDGEERNRLASTRSDRAKQLSARLVEGSRRQVAAASARNEDVAPEDLEALRALGHAE